MSKMRERLAALRQNYRMTKETHRWVGWEMLGIFIAVTAVVAAPIAFFLNLLTGLLIAIPLALLAVTYWFSRRAMNAAYTSIEGQPGAAAARRPPSTGRSGGAQATRRAPGPAR